MSTITKTLAAKGDRLVSAGQVERLGENSYRVTGDHGTYRVNVLDYVEVFGFCNCEATTPRCSHLYAAAVYGLANPVPESETSDDIYAGLDF